MTTTKRTKIELQAEIIAKDVRIAQLEKALLESVHTQTRYMYEQFQFQGAIKDRDSEIGNLQKLLRLNSLAGIRVAVFLEGKIEGVMTAFKTVLNNTKADDGDFPQELRKILEEMEQITGEDGLDEENELGID